MLLNVSGAVNGAQSQARGSSRVRGRPELGSVQAFRQGSPLSSPRRRINARRGAWGPETPFSEANVTSRSGAKSLPARPRYRHFPHALARTCACSNQALPTVAKILLVDDDSVVLGLLKTALESRQHVVIPVTSVDRALRYLTTERVDLVVTDVQMPGKSGLELIGAIRAIPGAPPVVAMSGGGYALSAQQCIMVAEEMGAAATITKPFSLAALFTAVDRGLDGTGSEGGDVRA